MAEAQSKFKVEFKKRLYHFVLEIIKLLDTLPKDNITRRLSDQLLRSSTSVIANFVEGQSASSKRDFINYLTISLKSSNESKLWMSLLKDSKRVDTSSADKYLQELKEISSILASSILKLKDKK